MPDAQADQVLMTSVLLALAGLRTGQAACVLGSPGRLTRAVEAGTGRPVVRSGPAEVVLAPAAADVPEAVLLLGPGGRLVAVATDEPAARRTAEAHRLALRHLEAVAGQVVWAAQAPVAGESPDRH